MNKAHKIKWIFTHIMRRIRCQVVADCGEQAYYDLHTRSSQTLLPRMPELGRSILAPNLDICMIFCAWFMALKEQGLSSDEAVRRIWDFNHAYLESWPAWVMKLGGLIWTLNQLRLGPLADEQARSGRTHPDDWAVRFQRQGFLAWRFDITGCGILKFARTNGLEEILPGLCRLDYLHYHYFGVAFRRRGTLADGCDRCDCRYHYPGRTAWPVPMDIEGSKISGIDP